MERLKLRMYFFVPYNLSPIQKAIQAGHAALEYAYEYGQTKEFKDFIENDKTWIILDGGTTNNGDLDSNELGTLNLILQSLHENKINLSDFYEPDLNNALTAICFIANERVWDIEKYPNLGDGNEYYKEYLINEGKNEFLRELIKDKSLA